MNYIRIAIAVEEAEQERIIGLLSQLDVTGFEQTPDELLAYIEQEQFSEAIIHELLHPLPFKVETIEEQNWNAVWESNFEPVVIQNFCAVRAHFHLPIIGVVHEMIITPKMSFGTGHHATTYMMMEHMSRMDFSNKTVFDFGTGTGLLAILAERLGAASVDAIDIDEWSVANTLENVANNDCTRIKVEQSTVVPARTYDIILANINRNIILEYLPQLANALAERGEILFSGLLAEDEEVIQSASLTQGLIFLRKEERTNWISLLFVKGNATRV